MPDRILRAFGVNWTRRRAASVLLAVGVVLIVASVSIGVLVAVAQVNAIRNTQLDGTPQGKKILRASDQIISCTTTEGACTRKNRREQADLIGGLVQSQRAAAASAAACAAQPMVTRLKVPAERTAAILACMTRLPQLRPGG